MKYAFLVLIFLFVNFVFCQELEDILEEESEPISQKTFGTFNGTRLLNGHSVETRQRGVLEFLISHRFGRVNSGFDQLFGLDDSNIRFGFEYAFPMKQGKQKNTPCGQNSAGLLAAMAYVEYPLFRNVVLGKNLIKRIHADVHRKTQPDN